MEKLSKKVQLLNEELKQAKTQKDTESAKEELDKALEEKSSLEQEATSSKAKESVLLNEIAALNALAEKTRQDAENAQKELEDLRIREKQ